MTDTPPASLSADPSLFFPGNIVTALVEAYTEIPDVEHVVPRPLRAMDPSMMVGVVSLGWEPGAIEIAGQQRDSRLLGQQEPTLQTYNFVIQALVVDMDTERGLMVHSIFSKIVRAMLARNEPLALRLAALTETTLGVTERFQAKGVARQRFAANEIEGQWLYLSTTEFWITTETSPA